MAITARVFASYPRYMQDFLTADGSLREGVYPAVEVEFINGNGDRIAAKTYTLRPLSAHQTIADVVADLPDVIAELTGRVDKNEEIIIVPFDVQTNVPPPDQPTLDEIAQLQKLAGQPLGQQSPPPAPPPTLP